MRFNNKETWKAVAYLISVIIFSFGVLSAIGVVFRCVSDAKNRERMENESNRVLSYYEWVGSPEYKTHEETYVLMEKLLDTNERILILLEKDCWNGSVSPSGYEVTPAQYRVPNGDERHYWTEHLRLLSEQNKILREIASRR